MLTDELKTVGCIIAVGLEVSDYLKNDAAVIFEETRPRLG
jgi:hypothetical protein